MSDSRKEGPERSRKAAVSSSTVASLSMEPPIEPQAGSAQTHGKGVPYDHEAQQGQLIWGTETLNVQLIFEPQITAGGWAIDDLYIDPYRKS